MFVLYFILFHGREYVQCTLHTHILTQCKNINSINSKKKPLSRDQIDQFKANILTSEIFSFEIDIIYMSVSCTVRVVLSLTVKINLRNSRSTYACVRALNVANDIVK